MTRRRPGRCWRRPAGRPGEDGICRNAAGQRLSLTFSTSTGVRARELLQQVMQSQWRSIGVETIIKNEPPAPCSARR